MPPPCYQDFVPDNSSINKHFSSHIRSGGEIEQALAQRLSLQIRLLSLASKTSDGETKAYSRHLSRSKERAWGPDALVPKGPEPSIASALVVSFIGTPSAKQEGMCSYDDQDNNLWGNCVIEASITHDVHARPGVHEVRDHRRCLFFFEISTCTP